MVVSCPCPEDHLCQFTAESVYSFVKYRVHKIDNGQTNGPMDRQKTLCLRPVWTSGGIRRRMERWRGVKRNRQILAILLHSLA